MKKKKSIAAALGVARAFTIFGACDQQKLKVTLPFQPFVFCPSRALFLLQTPTCTRARSFANFHAESLPGRSQVVVSVSLPDYYRADERQLSGRAAKKKKKTVPWTNDRSNCFFESLRRRRRYARPSGYKEKNNPTPPYRPGRTFAGEYAKPARIENWTRDKEVPVSFCIARQHRGR